MSYILTLMMQLVAIPAPTGHMREMAQAISAVCDGDRHCDRMLIAVAWLETRFYRTGSAERYSPWGLTAGRWRPGDSMDNAAHEAWSSMVHGYRRCHSWRRGLNRYNSGECYRGYGQCALTLVIKLERRTRVRGFSCPHRHRRRHRS